MRRSAVVTPPACCRRGDTAKVIVIVLASLFGFFVLVCGGAGVLGYFWWQKNFGRAMLTKPEDIRKLTAEMADITIPREFEPMYGSDIGMVGMRTVSYRWCPAGNCQPLDAGADVMGGHVTSGAPVLVLTAYSAEGAPQVDDAWDQMADDDVLKQSYVNFTKEVREFTIRGKTCKFYFVRGEPLAGAYMDEEKSLPTDDVAAPETAAKGTGEARVTVQGTFPGKNGSVSLSYQSSAEQYNEAKILELLQSIR
jgi:hypothetical protein